MAKKQEVKCPWCTEVSSVSGLKLERKSNGHGTIIERRCPKCAQVLAAYLEEEGDFLPRMRTF